MIMKQTVEEAAYDYATQKTKFRKDVLKEVDADNYVSRHADSMEDFQCGVQWEVEQSPWISVKERLPEPGKVVLLYDKNSIRNYVIGWLRTHKGYNKSMWTLSNGWVEDKDITHWMPIPSFNEILEANKDVLERIKEQGD